MLILAGVFSLSSGGGQFSLKQIFDLSLDPLILDLRLHRTLLAALVGGALTCSGITFQVLLKNPLADPYILGVSSAGALGITIAVLLKLSFWITPLFSLLGGGLVILIFTMLNETYQDFFSHRLLLLGVLLGFFFSSLVTLFLSLAAPFEGAELLYWLMGGVSREFSHSFIYLIGGLIFLTCLFLYQKSTLLNVLNFSDEEAHTLGVPIQPTKKYLLTLGSLLCAFSVSLSGTIGFVGLIVPHFVRSWFGYDHRLILPIGFLSGAIFVITADTCIRAFSSHEIPVGVVTALIGIPVFMFSLWRRPL